MGRRDAERDVIVIERGGSSFWWLLVGGAVGAGLALLFAPQAGEKTRRQLGLKLTQLKDSAEELYDEFKGPAIDPVTAEASDETDEAPPEEAAPGGGKAGRRVGGSPARRELEKRLAAARAKRHRALADPDEDEDEEPVA